MPSSKPTVRLAVAMAICGATSVAAIAQNQPAGQPNQPRTAQPGSEDAPRDDPRSQIRQLYQQTKSAANLEQYSEAIAQCQQLQTRSLTQAQSQYLKRLQAWALNRRGELYAEQAADLAQQGEDEQAGQLDAQALADFKEAVASDPTRWKAVHNLAVSQALAGQYQEAIAGFSRTLQLNSSYANAWFNRGEILYEQGEYERAVRDYDRAIALKPDDAGAYTSRGHANFQLRRFRNALNDYNRAVQLSPESADALTDRGDAYRSVGQWEQAASDYRQAVALDANSGRAYQGAAWLMATCPDPRYRNNDLAIQAAEKAVELSGEADHTCLDTLAAAYANAGHFQRAQETQTKAIEAAPESERESLQERLKLYEAQQAYRQEMRPVQPSGTSSE